MSYWAYTPMGHVEQVILLSPTDVTALALWVCDNGKLHESISDREQRRNADEIYERQCERNGGYCDECRDYAGSLLAHFDFKVKEPQP